MTIILSTPLALTLFIQVNIVLGFIPHVSNIYKSTHYSWAYRSHFKADKPTKQVSVLCDIDKLKQAPFESDPNKLLFPSSSNAASFNISISHRTETCLDFDFIKNEMQKSATTVLGKILVPYMKSNNLDEINLAYSMVEELSKELDFIPIRSSLNIWPVIRQTESSSSSGINFFPLIDSSNTLNSNSSLEFLKEAKYISSSVIATLSNSPLNQPKAPSADREELIEFASYLEEMSDIFSFLDENPNLPLFKDLSRRMKLPSSLLHIFKDSFDDEGELNGEKFPIIGDLKRQASLLKTKIENIMKNLLRSNDMRDKIADDGFEEIDGRYCLMLKNTYKKGFGIVHGSSNTGRTLYVEPMEVIEPTNELKSMYADIRKEENKIFSEMYTTIANNRTIIKAAALAIAELDGYRAKAIIGKRLSGIIPEVGDSGTIRCVDAKHPILLLRGVQPVGNKIVLDESLSTLVISGPNAGGKTIVLKTAGLFALMVKYAVPIPTKPGARVDIFEVMADIGDMQSVSGDLSTFSGHLVVCREFLLLAKQCFEAEKHSLVLLDEIGTGTDPAQGAALAQAILEALITEGAKVIVTTHYQRIKELAAENSRFQIAAMEFVNNKPTYKLRLGSVGESYALEAAKRMDFPDDVLERANGLLDNESKRLLALQMRLEEETEKARVRQDILDKEILDVSKRQADLELSKKELEIQIQKVKDGKIDDFLDDLREKEKELELLLRKAQELVAMSNEGNSADQSFSLKPKDKVIEEIKSKVKGLRIETEKSVVETAAEDIATPLPDGEPIEEGRTLIVLDKGNLFGSRGIVVKRNKGHGKIILRVAGAEIKLDRHLLGLPIKMSLTSGLNAQESNSTAEISAKDKRMLKMLQEELVDPDKLLSMNKKYTKNIKISGLRTTANTIDVRGMGYAESQSIITESIEDIIDADEFTRAVYINHGNTKAAESLKGKLRTWLQNFPLVRKANAAELSDGGDAYTVVEIDY